MPGTQTLSLADIQTLPLPGKGVVWAFDKPNGCTPGGFNGWTPGGVKGWTLFLTLNKRENRMKNQFIFVKFNLIFSWN